MLHEGTLAWLNFDTKQLKIILDDLNVPYSSEGKYLHRIKRKYTVVRGKPFVFITRVEDLVAEVTYLGYTITVPWYKLRPIIGKYQ